MKKAVLLCTVCSLILLALLGQAFAEETQEEYDFIFVVNHGHRIEETDDPQRVRFDWLRELADDYCGEGVKAALIGVPLAEEEPISFELADEAGLDQLSEALNALDKKYYESWKEALPSLKKAKELTENGSEDAVVVFVHSGTIDLAKEAELIDWINGLGNRFVVIETKADTKTAILHAELPEMLEINLKQPDADMAEALAVLEVAGELIQAEGVKMEMPVLPEAAEAELAEGTDGAETAAENAEGETANGAPSDAEKAEEAGERTDEDAEEATPAEPLPGMGWSFTLNHGGINRLLVLAEAKQAPAALLLANAAGEAQSIMAEAECTQLGDRLLIDCLLEEGLAIGSWTLIAPEGAMEEDIFIVPCWSELGAELTMAESMERGEPLQGTLKLTAGQTALDVQEFMQTNGITAKLEIVNAEGEARWRKLQPAADGSWSYKTTLESGEYAITAHLYDAAGAEMAVFSGLTTAVKAENVAPALAENAQTEQEIRYNDGVDELSIEWVFEELFTDTPGDMLYYSVEEIPESDIFDIVRKGKGITVTLTDLTEGSCEMTLTAADKEGGQVQAQVQVSSVDYLRLQKETTFVLEITKTERKGEQVDVALTPVFPEAMDAEFAQAMLDRIQPQMTLNGEAIELTRDGDVWTYSFTTDVNEKEYTVEVSVALDAVGYGAEEGAEAEQLTVEPQSVSFATVNHAPTATVQDSEYTITVEPFLRAKDYVATDVLDPLNWFADEDADTLAVTAAVEGLKLELSENQLRITDTAAEGSKAEITGDVAIAAITAGEYDVVFTATDVDGATAQVTVHVKADSQTMLALLIIAIVVAVAAVIAVCMLIIYQRKPSFKGWSAQVQVKKRSVFGAVPAVTVTLEKYQKSSATLYDIFRQTALPQIKGLATEALKGVTLLPDHHGVRVQAKLESGYKLHINGEDAGRSIVTVKTGTAMTLQRDTEKVLEITVISSK